MSEKEKFPLIVRAPNWVGDTILSLPSLEALSQMGFELHIFGSPWIKDLLATTPYHLYSLPRHIGIKEGSRILKSLPYENTVLFPHSLTSAIMAWWGGKKSIAYSFECRRIFLSKTAPRQTGLHFLEEYWYLAKFVANYLMPNKQWPSQIPKKVKLSINQSQLDNAKQILHANKINQPYWVLCPMAKGEQFRVWPYWKEFSELLANQGVRFIACPGPGEEADCQKLLPNGIVLPNIKLGEYLAIMSGAEQIISNVTGPMHMAATLDVPMLGILGKTDPNIWRPWGGRYIGDQNGWPSVNEVAIASGIIEQICTCDEPCPL